MNQNDLPGTNCPCATWEHRRHHCRSTARHLSTCQAQRPSSLGQLSISQMIWCTDRMAPPSCSFTHTEACACLGMRMWITSWTFPLSLHLLEQNPEPRESELSLRNLHTYHQVQPMMLRPTPPPCLRSESDAISFCSTQNLKFCGSYKSAETCHHTMKDDGHLPSQESEIRIMQGRNEDSLPSATACHEEPASLLLETAPWSGYKSFSMEKEAITPTWQ